ncbi:MAG: phosphoribosylformylglycinamidine cyclo-ligase [Gemmatimonadetes bacterium]|nr:phosphoribosylformylglycinamidine cyclo-ligase [Gemmatimonadota bacterium]
MSVEAGAAAQPGRILAVGSVALDDIATPAFEVKSEVGGAAVHFAAGASLFAPVTVVGVVGADFPLESLDFLKERGTDLSGLAQLPGESFRWGASYSEDMNTRETTFTRLGVFEHFDPKIPAHARPAPWVFLGNIHPSLQLGVLEQTDRPQLAVCNTMNYWINTTPNLLEQVLSRVDVLLINDEEARMLSGVSSLPAAAAAILAKGPSAVVITRSEYGAALFTETGGTFVVPGYPVSHVVDPTGAGDAFAAGFVGELARSRSVRPDAMKRALAYGVALGAFACEEPGVRRAATLTTEEIEGRVREIREMTNFELRSAPLARATQAARAARFTYSDAGVDRHAARAAKKRIGVLVAGTRTDAVLSRFGGFGGRFRASTGRDLIATADGVGTKLKLAFMSGRHGTVGADLVNHCVNDILVEGAVPLVFMDYFACGRLDPDVTAQVVAGLAGACQENGCALLGGETAEMPDFYSDGEYDLAGFMVGESEFKLGGAESLREGDRLVALASSGLHTNGYSFARKVIFELAGLAVADPFPGMEAEGVSVADVLLRVHRSYLPVLRHALEQGVVKALAHVTGGGIPGNLDRSLADTLDAVVHTDTWTPPPEFAALQELSGAERSEMFQTFNMGVGMIAVVDGRHAESVRSGIESTGCEAWTCGSLVPGRGEVRLVEP